MKSVVRVGREARKFKSTAAFLDLHDPDINFLVQWEIPCLQYHVPYCGQKHFFEYGLALKPLHLNIAETLEYVTRTSDR